MKTFLEFMESKLPWDMEAMMNNTDDLASAMNKIKGNSQEIPFNMNYEGTFALAKRFGLTAQEVEALKHYRVLSNREGFVVINKEIFDKYDKALNS